MAVLTNSHKTNVLDTGSVRFKKGTELFRNPQGLLTDAENLCKFCSGYRCGSLLGACDFAQNTTFGANVVLRTSGNFDSVPLCDSFWVFGILPKTQLLGRF